MIRRLWVVLLVAAPFSLCQTHVAVALNDTSTNASNCGLAAGHDATGNVVNCGYPAEKMELMQDEVQQVLQLAKQLAATNSTAPTPAGPNISIAELDTEFPLGFAIFYSDGRSIKYATKQNSRSGVSFDPSNLEVTKEGIFYCLNELPVLFDGRPSSMHFNHVCVGGTTHFAKINDVTIDIKPLGTSGDKSAWVIGAS